MFFFSFVCFQMHLLKAVECLAVFATTNLSLSVLLSNILAASYYRAAASETFVSA